MNKVEALKACLDGKKVRLDRQVLSYDGRSFVTTETAVTVVIAYLPDDGYELYVEPPREVTRAEAWAALDRGKVAEVVWEADGDERRTLFKLDNLGLMTRPRRRNYWELVRSEWVVTSGMTGAKFYILDGEP